MQKQKRYLLIRASTIRPVISARRLTAFSIYNKTIGWKELISHLNSRLQIATSIITEIDDKVAKTFLRECGKCNKELCISGFAKVLYLDIASIAIYHIGSRNTLRLNLITSDTVFQYLLTSITQYPNLNLRAFLALQTTLSFLGCNFLTNEFLSINSYNLVSGKETGTFCRSIGNDILDMNCILANDKLNAHTEERAFKVVNNILSFGCRDIRRMRVEFRHYLRNSLFYKVIDIDSINILIVNDMKQVIQTITARINDVQSVTREVVGIKSSNHNTDDYT